SLSNGFLAIGNNGTPLDKADDYFVYTPNTVFIGSDDFTYTIIEGNGTRDRATVTLSVIELASNVTVEACNPTPAADYNP
ncbi:Ig-like domain-containing protein, partial [Maribacter flavus]|uniref:Ig-like domain-containing protein n=1 Tax=Maribacter flavus TaxID=1658664 RepID=UPI003D347F85